MTTRLEKIIKWWKAGLISDHEARELTKKIRLNKTLKKALQR